MASEGNAVAPAVTVVVPTYRRPELLRALLDGFSVQTDLDFELIVVDDASGDVTEAVLREVTLEVPFPLRAVHLDRNGGPARARNHGWRLARAPLVAFTDDDCVPRPEWVAEIRAATREADAVQGTTVVDPTEWATKAGPFSRWIDTGFNPFYETCNIAYPRAVLETLDGFEETFRYAAGEDTDFAYRAIEQGTTIGPAPLAIVQHVVHPSSFRAGLRSTRRLDGLVQAIERHPDHLRKYVGGPLFWFPAHARAALAALGGVLGLGALLAGAWAAALAAAVLLALPYVWLRLFVKPLPCRSKGERLTSIPAAWVVDLVELFVVTRARWRYRGSAVSRAER